MQPVNLRLSFGEFQQELLFRIAIVAEADFDKFVPAEIAASLVEGRYPSSWIRTSAAQLLSSHFLMETSRNAFEKSPAFDILSQEPFSVGLSSLNIDAGGVEKLYKLTVRGLEEAEQHGRSKGVDLYDAIEEYSGNFTMSASNSYDYEDNVGAQLVDGTSPQYLEIKKTLSEAIDKLKSQNEVIAEAGAAGSQKIAELEAGQRLLGGEQVNPGLAKRVMIPSLQWFLRRVRDDALGSLLKKLIDLLIAYLV